MANCLICKRELDVPGDRESADCGGDCTRCMADAGDPDCIRALGNPNKWQLVVFSAECNDDGDCPFCMMDYGDCPCPGPTQDGYEYEEVGGILYARKLPDAD